ncbi:hypothetical protein KL86DYS1_11034 [uncultured Dysgonomonas sp.]|uniref:Uncharacterized protein n=1 Tax=uncultured Dysgonomonas sp. TaxID=206096 RepID=A0A212J3N1_9BACT|nr:hypothetical protein KL86DYS1_11034 [uncultured Dysgonomonas sp.]
MIKGIKIIIDILIYIYIINACFAAKYAELNLRCYFFRL